MADTGKQSQSTRAASRPAAGAAVIHPLYVRITHWINALAMLIMIGSGWQIYNASPLFALHLSRQHHAGRLAGRRPALAFRRHVAADRQRPRLPGARVRDRPFPPQAAADPAAPRSSRDVGAALTGRLRHDDLGRYNAVQKLLYVGILLTGVVIVALRLRHLEAGAAAGARRPVRRLRGRARCVHFFAMAAIVLFLVVHVVMALLVPEVLRAMISGR